MSKPLQPGTLFILKVPVAFYTTITIERPTRSFVGEAAEFAMLLRSNFPINEYGQKPYLLFVRSQVVYTFFKASASDKDFLMCFKEVEDEHSA